MNSFEQKFDAWWSPLGMVKKRWFAFLAGAVAGFVLGIIL